MIQIVLCVLRQANLQLAALKMFFRCSLPPSNCNLEGCSICSAAGEAEIERLREEAERKWAKSRAKPYLLHLVTSSY